MALLSIPACGPEYPEGGLAALDDPPPQLDRPTTTYLDLGRGYLQIGDLRRAKDAFIRSLRLEGSTAAALTGAGIASERQGLLNEARRYFEMALELAPSSEIAHNNLGAVQYRLGDYRGAKRSFENAFAISSGTSKVASHNLRLTELAIKARSEYEVPVVENPTPLQREGTSEYRLLTAETNEEEEQGG